MLKKLLFVWLTAVLLTLPGVASASPVSGVVPLDSWVYPALDKLSGLGLIDSGLQGLRPVSRMEAARQVLEAREAHERGRQLPVVRELLLRLDRELAEEVRRLTETGRAQTYVQPLRSAEFSYLYRDGDKAVVPATNARQFPLNYNNFGIEYGEGSNGQLVFESEANLGGWFALNARPLYEVQEEGAGGSFHLLEGRAALGLGPFEFSAGRQALWWGQGRHGTLVLSNNAKPLDMLRVNTPSPVLLPWIFRYLGPVQLDLFVSELEKERVVPEPYFGGLRIVIKPLPWLEIGAARAVMFGGGDRDISFDDFLTIIGGENLSGGDDTSNSVAGLDARIRIPPLGGLELYGEVAGEDEADALGFLPFISQVAYVSGIYLPRIEPSGRASLRVEYANLIERRNGVPVWYRHGLFRSGYTFEERILGHHAGGDAQDLFVQLGVNLPWNLNLSVEFDYEKRGESRPVTEKHYQPAVELEWALQNRFFIQGRYAFDHVDSFGFNPEDDREFHFAALTLRYLW